MPRVPVPAGNVVELRPMTDEKFRAADNNGGALGGLGQGLQQLGRTGSEYAEAQDHLNAQMDEAGAKQQLVGYSTFRDAQIHTGDNAYLNTLGENALHARAGVEAALDGKIQELSGGLKTPRAKFLFQQAITQERQRDELEIAGHATKQVGIWHDQTDTALQAQAGQDFIGATLRGDADAAAMARGTMVNSIRAQYDRNGLSGAPSDEALAKIMSGVNASVVDAKTRADPVGAAAYLHAHEAEMLPTDRAKLADSLYAPLVERQASAIVDGYPGAVAGAVPVVPQAAPGSGSMASRMVAITAHSESGNRDYVGGKVITSSKGAQAAMQTMPGTQRDPGFGIKPAQDDSVAEKNRVGREYLGKMSQRYGGDPAKAWAAYNAGPGSVDTAVKKGGANWLASMPEETRAYVAKNVAMLGTDGPTYAPRRDDLNGLYAYIEKQNLPFDEKQAAMAEADKRVARDDRLLERQQKDAYDQATTVKTQLGDGFTSVNQIPPQVRRNLSPQAVDSLTTEASQNSKAERVPANGDAIINLHQLAQSDREKFIGTNLNLYRPYMTRGEYDQVATLQASMGAKPVSDKEVSHSRIWQQISFYGRDIGVDMAAKKKGENDEVFKARRQDGMALFTVMENYISTLTGNKRQPTDDEIKRAFDNAVMPRVMGDGTNAPRYRDASLPTNSVAVPQSAHDRIARGLKARGLPSDDRHVALVYMQGK